MGLCRGSGESGLSRGSGESSLSRGSNLSRMVLVLVAVVIAGCGQTNPPSVTVGAGPDPESALLAHLYAAALRYYGSATRVEPGDDPLRGLDAGTAGVVPGFTGALLATFEPDAVARGDAQVYREMVAALPEGVAAGDYTVSAEDKPAVAVTEDTASEWGGRDVAALVRNCADARLGAVAGADVPRAIGSCRPAGVREFRDSEALFAALHRGDVDAAWTSTAAPDIPDDLVVLADRTSLIRAENVVPLYRRNELNESQVLAINEIAGVLDTAALAQMRAQMAQGDDPASVADAWLAAHPLGR